MSSDGHMKQKTQHTMSIIKHLSYVYVGTCEIFLGVSAHRREMALALVYGADFWCNRRCTTSPVDLEGSRGQVLPKSGRKSTPLRTLSDSRAHLSVP